MLCLSAFELYSRWVQLMPSRRSSGAGNQAPSFVRPHHMKIV